jgi:hypothetical protein
MPLYQGDIYTFTLFLGRKDTSSVAIYSVSNTGGVSTYTYLPVSGPPLELGTTINVTGMASNNNGPFTITGMGILVNYVNVVTGYTFTCNSASGATQTHAGSGTVGTSPNVTTSPVVQIVQLNGFAAMLGSAAPMIAIDDTDQVWTYSWSIGAATSGQYVAIASYVVDGNTFNSVPIEKITVGDSRITGAVALDATVAHDATCAQDATVAHVTDLATINPNTSPVILAIQASTANLPIDPAGMTLLSSYLQDVVDLHDVALGNQIIDKTQTPPLFTMKRLDNSVLANFNISDDSNQTTRTQSS